MDRDTHQSLRLDLVIAAFDGTSRRLNVLAPSGVKQEKARFRNTPNDGQVIQRSH